MLNATPIANVADNASSSPLTNLYISLHTADPGETGSPTTSEATYTGYARKAVLRNNSTPKWTITDGAASNSEAITFDPCTGGSNTITYFGVCSTSSGAGVLYYSGQLTASLAVSSGITPQFAIGDCDITED